VQAYLLALMVVTTLAGALPICLVPLAWAQAMEWVIPAL
jgi:hypothetical protein